MINQKLIDDLAPGSLLWDDKVSGLHIKAGKNSKNFYYYCRIDGKQRRPKIGAISMVSLGAARKIATKWALSVVVGEDPFVEVPLDASILLDDWFAEARPEIRTSWDKESHRLYQKNIGPIFGQRSMGSISVNDVRQWLQGFKRKPYEGNRSLSVLTSLYNVFPDRVFNPCTKVKRFPEQARDRTASPEEIEAVGKALEREQLEHPAAVAYIYFLLYTGCRPAVVATFSSDMLELNDTSGLIKFKGKNGWEQVTVPRQVIPMLKREPGQPLVGASLYQARALWNKIREEIGAEDLWLRDLRRTFGSVGLSDGVSVDQLGELLNHKSAQTTKRYANLIGTKRAEATQQIADKLEDLL